MKTGRSRKYYLMEAVLILFNILINLINFCSSARGKSDHQWKTCTDGSCDSIYHRVYAA